MAKLIIFSAPSGSGKSTIINQLMQNDLNLHFSISATNRPPRGLEKNGVEYHFLSTEDFKRHIAAHDFLEYEEVYPGRYYGTLRSEVDKMLQAGKNVVCDVDVLGAQNIKKYYGNKALSIFIQPPSIEELRKRLEQRATDSQEVIEARIARAEYELSFSSKFDSVVINDDLSAACREVLSAVRSYLEA